MKKLCSFLMGFVFLIVAANAKGQAPAAPADYFPGKWNVLIKGTPQGDSKMMVTLERKDGKLAGYLSSKELPDSTKFSKVEETEKSVTVSFTAQGYDVTLTLEKKDADHVTGSMMGMFDAEGDRIKDTVVK